ncbi:hypothetical protein E8E13_008841 [Curvularia kusanoi]|uniref:F-box domain-containing protein n=1 Tax=Curvularia kusanoi TaxID=90978 RepID=A0A9P4TIX3_CURKU|nr:hypothetical protein E8E13_008841 [Curvularia kusanoi]
MEPRNYTGYIGESRVADDDEIQLAAARRNPQLYLNRRVPEEILANRLRSSRPYLDRIVPEELLLVIINFLEGDNVALANLASTSRKFSRLTQQMLYQTITIASNPTSNATMNLVRTLLYRPEYRFMVKNLNLTCFTYERDEKAALDGHRHRFGRNPDFQLRRQHDRLVKDCAEYLRVSEVDDAGASTLIISQWKASLANRESAAFASMLLALCPSLQSLAFQLEYDAEGWSNHTNRFDSTIPALFGQNDALEELRYRVKERSYFQESWPSSPAPTFNMPAVSRICIGISNLDLLLLGFPNLSILDVNLVSTRAMGFSASVISESRLDSLPTVQGVIFRIDWEELGYGNDGGIMVFIQTIKLPQVSSVAVVLERSPRYQELFMNPPAGFPSLYDKLNNVHSSDPEGSPTLLARLKELKVLISDDVTAFNKYFLYRLDPFTCLLDLPCLERLTVPWTAISVPRNREGSVKPQSYDAMISWPLRLETLRITYPDEQTAELLAELLQRNPELKHRLQTIEFLFDKNWGILEGFMHCRRWEILNDLPVKVTGGSVPSVADEVGSCQSA